MTKEDTSHSHSGSSHLPLPGSPPPPISAPPHPPVAASPHRFYTQVAWTVAVRLLMIVNSVAAGIIVARWLGAQGVGLLGVLNVTVAMMVQLGSGGLPSANTYFIAKDRKYFFTAALNSLFFSIVVGSVLAVGWTILGKLRPDWFGFISADLIKVAAVSIPFQLIILIGLNIFLALGNVKRFNLIDLTGQSFVLVNAVVALVILKAELRTLVSLNTAASVLIGVLMVTLIAHYGARLKVDDAGWRFDLRPLGRLMRYGLKFHVSILAAALMFRADLLVVNHFRGLAEAGVYSIATQVSMMLMLLPSVIATLLFPRVTAEQDVRGETTCRVTRHVALLMVLVCLAAVPLSFILPSLYGPGFADLSIQLLILLPGVYLIGVQSILVQHFNALGLPPAIPMFWVTALATNIILLFLLVPHFGARGAAVASTISYAIIFALNLVYFRVTTGNHFSKVLLVRGREFHQLLSLGTSPFEGMNNRINKGG